MLKRICLRYRAEIILKFENTRKQLDVAEKLFPAAEIKLLNKNYYSQW